MKLANQDDNCSVLHVLEGPFSARLGIFVGMNKFGLFLPSPSFLRKHSHEKNNLIVPALNNVLYEALVSVLFYLQKRNIPGELSRLADFPLISKPFPTACPSIIFWIASKLVGRQTVKTLAWEINCKAAGPSRGGLLR
jgi:hypothetical protein